VTDSGIKKSAKGIVSVVMHDGVMTLRDRQLAIEESLLKTVFKDGQLLVNDNLSAIRRRMGGV